MPQIKRTAHPPTRLDWDALGGEERFRMLSEAAFEGICIHEAGVMLACNAAFATMFGYAESEVIGKTAYEFTTPECHRTIEANIRDGSESPYELVGVRKNGSTFDIETRARTIPYEGRMVRVTVVRDITDRKRAEAELKHLAEHDHLTGLYNRRRFEQEVADCLAAARRDGRPGAVLVLDLDNFKYVNDTSGHGAGDELIQRTGRLLRDRLRKTDALARIGGDEFAVLLSEADERTACSVAEGLLRAVRDQRLLANGTPVHLTTSIGIAVFGALPATPEELVSSADLAMYDAKEAGRDRLSVYRSTDERRSNMEAGLAWSERIRQALERDELVLYCQPILDLRTGEVARHELLLRMLGDDGEIVPPAAFLGTAERFGLIEAIDRWVTRRAIRLIAEHRDAGRRVSFDVNISGRSVGESDLTSLIQDELVRTGIDSSCLGFEITETAAIVNMGKASEFAERLVKLGCRLALDDFGAGFGSFYYLKRLPLDVLKLDGEYIRNLPSSEHDQLVVRNVVPIAKGLGMETIGEFVEDEATLEMLRDFGVDYGQGYHIGRPFPVEEI